MLPIRAINDTDGDWSSAHAQVSALADGSKPGRNLSSVVSVKGSASAPAAAGGEKKRKAEESGGDSKKKGKKSGGAGGGKKGAKK
jgi:hypothetical protein